MSAALRRIKFVQNIEDRKKAWPFHQRSHAFFNFPVAYCHKKS
jgi:hypothetical protein